MAKDDERKTGSARIESIPVVTPAQAVAGGASNPKEDQNAKG